MNERQYDLAVIGLGAMGAMAAWRGVERNASIVGFEQFGPAHARGSSHGGSRIFRQTLFEGTDYVPLVQRSGRLWAELAEQSGTTLFTRTGGLCIGAPEGEIVRDALASARFGGFEHEVLDPDALAARYPQHCTIADDVAVCEPGAGVLNPEACVRAAVERARAGGADLRFETVVSSIETDDDGVRVRADGESIRAAKVVLATGAWFTDLVPQLHLPLRVQRSPLVWFTGKDRAAYRPDRFPVFVRESGAVDGWGIPDVDGRGVKLGAGPGDTKPWLDHASQNDYPPDARDTGPAEAFCAAGFPGLDPHAAHVVPCMNSKSPDQDFVIGTAESQARIVLVGGFSGHGFKHAAAVGDVAVELAMDGGSDIPLERFSPQRFTTTTVPS